MNGFCSITDPLRLKEVLWPQVTFYRQQKEIIYSVWENDSTIVPAGNMLGKDFVAGFITVAFFLTRWPCRVVTTSADGSQLESVLWGEIKRFIQTAKYPLTIEKGGPLEVTHLRLRKLGLPLKSKELCPLSYCIGRVAAKGEGMLGHHIADVGDGVPRTLFIADEASGVDTESWDKSETWAQRKLAIGNPYPCNNFFKEAVRGGPRPDGSTDPGGDQPRPPHDPRGGYYRRVIQIKAEHSPNVRYGLAQRARGVPPTGDVIIPGVLPWGLYEKRRATWDLVRQCVSLDAEFYEGAGVLMYPPDWLNRSEAIGLSLPPPSSRRAKGIGIDPAEGGDSTAMCAVDEWGVLELVSKKTPDTSVITSEALAFVRKWDVPHSKVCFDAGGGGKQHADLLRSRGYAVRAIPFGGGVDQEPKRGLTTVEQKKDVREERYEYVNRRAQMYGRLRELLDPAAPSDPPPGFPAGWKGFCIPATYPELRRQLSPVPLLYDPEGRLKMLPKNPRPGQKPDGKSLSELIGRSPDEADALVLALHGMMDRPKRAVAGSVGL